MDMDGCTVVQLHVLLTWFWIGQLPSMPFFFFFELVYDDTLTQTGTSTSS